MFATGGGIVGAILASRDRIYRRARELAHLLTVREIVGSRQRVEQLPR